MFYLFARIRQRLYCIQNYTFEALDASKGSRDESFGVESFLSAAKVVVQDFELIDRDGQDDVLV